MGQPPGVERPLHVNSVVRPLAQLVVHRQVEEGDFGLLEYAPFAVTGRGRRCLVIVEQFRAADEGVRRRFQFRE